MNLEALLLGRCPRCRRGPIFNPWLGLRRGAMNERCHVCGLPFLRQSG